MATERLAIKVDEKGALQVSRNIDDIGKSAKDTGGALKLLKRALGALAVAALTKQLISMADTFTVIQNKLKIVTTGTENLATVTDELFEIATRTRSSFEATADSYSKFALSAKELGRSQKEMLEFTELVNKAVIIGGSAASEAAGGLRQLAQGIASGALRGDELISVLENLPFVADTIAKGLGITRGKLRDLGKEGKITAQVVLDAFKSQADFLNTEYNKTVITVGQSMTLLKNAALKLVGGVDGSTGATKQLAGVIASLAENLADLDKFLAMVGDTATVVFSEMKKGVDALDVSFTEMGTGAVDALSTTGLALLSMLKAVAIVVDKTTGGFNAIVFIIMSVSNAIEDALATSFNKLLKDVETLINGIIKGINKVRALAGQGELDLIEIPKFDNDKAGAFATLGENMSTAIEEGFGRTTMADSVDRLIDGVYKGVEERNAAEIKRLQGGSDLSATGDAAAAPTELYDAAITKLTEQNALLQMNNHERSIEAQLLKTKAVLLKGGQPLTGPQEEAYRILLETNAALKDQAAIMGQVTGPQQAYTRAMAALTELKPELTVEQFNKALADISPYAAATAAMEEEARLLGMTNAERTKEIDLLKLRRDAAAAGEELSPEQEASYLALRATNLQLAEQARLLEDIKGPQIAYLQTEKALNQLRMDGDITLQEYNSALKDLKASQDKLGTESNEFGKSMVKPWEDGLNALMDFSSTGKLVIGDFVADILSQMAKIAAAKAIAGAFGGLGLPGFATGGSFMVGGQGGVDSQTVAFRATPGERVTVAPPGKSAPRGAAPQAAAPIIKIVNISDPSEIPAVMASSEGEKVIINVLAKNRDTVRQAVS